jgi:hypothetical protein
MKKILSFLSVGILALSTQLYAVSSDDFNYDFEAHEAEFAQIAEVEEAAVVTGFSFVQLASEDSPYKVDGIEMGMAPLFSIDDMDWGAFAWGFCCWPIGLFVVVFNSRKDGDQKLSFFLGLAFAAVIGAIGGVSFFI